MMKSVPIFLWKLMANLKTHIIVAISLFYKSNLNPQLTLLRKLGATDDMLGISG